MLANVVTSGSRFGEFVFDGADGGVNKTPDVSAIRSDRDRWEDGCVRSHYVKFFNESSRSFVN